MKFNFYLGAAVSAWLLSVLVVATEISAPFKNLLKTLMFHHWVGKAVLVSLAFVAFGFILKDKKSLGSLSDENVAWYSALFNLAFIFLVFTVFYFIEQ